jgi:hypothetical protein
MGKSVGVVLIPMAAFSLLFLLAYFMMIASIAVIGG